MQSKDRAYIHPYLPLLKYIVATIALGCLCCGLVYGLFYLNLNLPYIRADVAISQAKGVVAPLYDRMSVITAPTIQVKNRSGVQSGMYAFSLSDGAEQSAHVWARLDLASDAPAQDVIAPYRAFWKTEGFSEVLISDEPANMRNLFRSSLDHNLVGGVCVAKSSTSHYVVFIDYDNGPICENNYPNPLQCIVARYCAS